MSDTAHLSRPLFSPILPSPSDNCFLEVGRKALAEALHVLGLCFLDGEDVRAFSDCSEETSLNLQNNYLRTLPTPVLALTQLKSLDLSNNRFEQFPVADLLVMPSMQSVNLSNNRLERLPVAEILAMPALRKLDCKGNPGLVVPPPEIAEQGGEEVVQYLRLAYSDEQGTSNTDIELIMIGHGESGKTSVVRMLMNGRSDRIHEDTRTVGIDMTTYDLSDAADGLVFKIKDLAGQAVYSMTNQFFLVRRAIFVLVWRVVRPASVAGADEFEREVTEMVSTWLDAVHYRVPGARVVIVATHVDCATPGEVDNQCRMVKEVVQHKLRVWEEDTACIGIPTVTVWGAGDSVRVNCLAGVGVEELRKCLVKTAHGLPFWREGVPKTYLLLRDKIEERAKTISWLSQAEYVELARECGIESIHIEIATKFLHDCAALKYFGKYPMNTQDSNAILDSVFIDPKVC